MKKLTYQLETLTCPSCSGKIEKALSKTEGVESVEVLFNSSRVKLVINPEFTSSQELKRTIMKLGFRVISEKE